MNIAEQLSMEQYVTEETMNLRIRKGSVGGVGGRKEMGESDVTVF